MYLLWNLMTLRLRLIFRNMSIKILVILMLLIFGTLIGSLYQNEMSSTQIKMGYVDLSQSNFSRQVIKNIHGNELLDPVETTLKAGIDKVKNSEIEVLFVIKKDAEQKVIEGDFEELMDLYYISGNYLPPMIGDVVVGEMFEEISLRTALNMLRDLESKHPNQELLLQEAYQHGQELGQNKKENYYVTIEVINLTTQQRVSAEKINHQILYKQMILGIILCFLLFFLLFAATNIVKDEENKMTEKIALSKTTRPLIVISEYLSVLIPTTIIAFLCALISASYSSDFMGTLIKELLALFFYSCTSSALILLLAKCFKNVASFVVIGATFILVLGIISGCFFNIDLTISLIKSIALYTPTYQTLTQLMSIIVSDSFTNFMSYLMYTIISITVLLVLTMSLSIKKRIR